jgi:hypothetical protein
MTLPRPLPWLGLALLVVGVVGCGSLKDERPAKWSFIYATIIQPQCATVNCHSDIAKKGGVDMHDLDSACAQWGGTQVLKSDSGSRPRMPPDAPLPAPDIELIDLWQVTPPAGGCNAVGDCGYNDADPNHGICPPLASAPASSGGGGLTSMFTVEVDHP